ncbi:MAG: hypothetical protein VXZ96_02055 [Myxococcota bacterium]|nr:hypothetical protein [Myxococcota bacterium]
MSKLEQSARSIDVPILSGNHEPWFIKERNFLAGLVFAAAAAVIGVGRPELAMWIGFLFAAYAAIANDSIQTIGTFIASNRHRPWWHQWLFIGGIFLATVTYSWMNYNGDVSFQRLAAKGFETAPSSFHYLQIIAPLFLILLTRLKMPVSTTFLLLSSFAASSTSIMKVMGKSFMGYGLAFGIAIAVWLSLSHAFERWFTGKAAPQWRIFQWITTGVLWSVWIMQDAANIAVYLPRQLSVVEFLAFAGTIFVALGFLFRMGGERVQEIVDEKSHVVDVRAATIIDLIYALILFYFKMYSKLPMSTTWVFLGLLGGRELAMALKGTSKYGIWPAVKIMCRDTGAALIGLVLSLLIAMVVNDTIRDGILSTFGL